MKELWCSFIASKNIHSEEDIVVLLQLLWTSCNEKSGGVSLAARYRASKNI
jgi:hypothetical protein